MPLNTQITILKDLASLFSVRIDKIEVLGTEIGDKFVVGCPIIYKKNSIILFRDTLAFLSEKIESEKDENFKFYIPHLRILFENCIRMTYLVSQDADKQAILCLVNTLFPLAKAIQSKKVVNKELVLKTYKDNFNLAKEFLHDKNLDILENPEFCSKRFLKKNKILFPDVSEMVNGDFVIKYSPQVYKSFPKITDDLYYYYIAFSEYSHGNPLVAIPHGNEKYWILITSMIFGALLCELIDHAILEDHNNEEFYNWLNRMNNARSDFITFVKGSLSNTN